MEDDIDYVLATLPPIANRLLEMSPFYKGWGSLSSISGSSFLASGFIAGDI
jgi:hypothetical protein